MPLAVAAQQHASAPSAATCAAACGGAPATRRKKDAKDSAHAKMAATTLETSCVSASRTPKSASRTGRSANATFCGFPPNTVFVPCAQTLFNPNPGSDTPANPTESPSRALAPPASLRVAHSGACRGAFPFCARHSLTASRSAQLGTVAVLCSSTLDAGSVGGLFCRSHRSMETRSYVWPVCDSNTGSSYRSHDIGHRRWSGGSGGGARPALRTA